MNKEPIDVYRIVRMYLEKNWYDGLYDPEERCACTLDDLFPCDSEFLQRCIPGIKGPCDCTDPEDLGPGGTSHEFHIVDKG